jgi:hypothetical protein
MLADARPIFLMSSRLFILDVQNRSKIPIQRQSLHALVSPIFAGKIEAMKFGVVIFPGSNCDQDMIYVLRTL